MLAAGTSNALDRLDSVGGFFLLGRQTVADTGCSMRLPPLTSTYLKTRYPHPPCFYLPKVQTLLLF